MNKKTLIKKLVYGHDNVNFTFQQIGNLNLQNTIIEKNWLPKDVLAHVTWYMKEVIATLATKSTINSTFWSMSIEDRNNYIFNNTHAQDFQILLNEFEDVFHSLIKSCEILTEENLISEDYISLMKGKRKTFDFILGNVYFHFDDHIDVLIENFDLDYGVFLK